MPNLAKPAALMIACGLLTAGCQPIAAILDKAGGDPKVMASYKPDHEVTLVLVEDFQNPALVEIAGDHMQQVIAEQLVANKVAPVVNPQRLSVFKVDHADEYRQMKLPQIGSQLGAKQVLYVNVTEFATGSAGATNIMHGRASARVKMVDCATGQTRWPHDAAATGYFLEVEVPFAADSQNTTSSAVRHALAKALADRVAHLFYDYTVDQPDQAPIYPETDFQ